VSETAENSEQTDQAGEIQLVEPQPLPAAFKRRRGHIRTETITVPQIETFLTTLADTGLHQHSCDVAVIGYNTILRLRKEDEDFKEMYEEAMTHYRESLHREAERRAKYGWDEPVFSQRLGTQIGTVRKYDTRLMELMLKRHIPEFREKFEGEIKVTGGVLVAPVSCVSPEDWEREHGQRKLRLFADDPQGMLPENQEATNAADQGKQ
jgi:hypothetical protein